MAHDNPQDNRCMVVEKETRMLVVATHDNPQNSRCMIVEKENRALVVSVDEFREFEKDVRILVVPPRKKQS